MKNKKRANLVQNIAQVFSSKVLEHITARQLANVIQGKAVLNDYYDSNIDLFEAYNSEAGATKVEDIDTSIWNDAEQTALDNHYFITEI